MVGNPIRSKGIYHLIFRSVSAIVQTHSTTDSVRYSIELFNLGGDD